LDGRERLGVVAAGVWYVMMLRRVGKLTDRHVGRSHAPFFFAGLAVIVAALGSPVNTMAVHWLLSLHMLQHTLLADIAPPLLILGLRSPILPLGMPGLASRLASREGLLGRFWAFATKPLVTIPVWSATLIFWSLPGPFDYATQHQLLRAFQHFTLFATGFALWWLIVTPLPGEQQITGFARLGYIGASRFASALVCLPVTFASSTLYPLYASFPRGFGVSAATDQHIAGASMCLIEFIVFGIAMALVFVDVLNREERAQLVSEHRLVTH